MPERHTHKQFLAALKSVADPAAIDGVSRFFRVEAGAPRTKFLGVSPGAVFPVAKRFAELPLTDVERLLDSPYYEARLGGVAIMDFQARAKRSSVAHREALYDLYLRRHDRIDNWDLVDRAAPHVVGGWLADKPRDALYRLARSRIPSERRTAIVATWFFIRADDVDDTFRIAELLVADEHDLVQKAVGSWLREAGKRDQPRLVRFLQKHAATMPRTMLRYAAEKLPATTRAKLLKAVLIVACAALGACTNPEEPRDERNLVRIQSDAGDVAGGGGSYEYTLANSQISLGQLGGGALAIEVIGDEFWSLYLYSATPEPALQPGTYESVTFFDPKQPKILIRRGGGAPICVAPTGRFTISNVGLSSGNQLSSVDVTFEQRCQGASAGLRGTVHWRLGDLTKPPGPAPIPSSLWRPVPGTTPAGGSYVHLVSESGDPVGQGLSDSYSLPDPSAVVTWVSHGLSIGNFGRWVGRFEMPTSVARAEVGYYAGLRGTPTYNPTRGSVQWGVDGRSCEVESGWLAIDGITYDVRDAIAALDLRFEQRCKGSTGALHGQVHVGR